MTHLRIEQNNIQENVSSAVIEKLYQLAISGDLDYNSNLAGNLHTTVTYQEYIDAIIAEYPNLTISADNYYILFQDQAIANYLKNFIGDGIGVFKSTALTATSLGQVGGLASNTQIQTFSELGQFLNITTIPHAMFKDCSNLTSINLSNITSLKGLCFENSGLSGIINVPKLTDFTSDAGGHSTNYFGGGRQFNGCAGITEVYLGNDVSSANKINSVPNEAFRYCTNLQKIVGLSECTNIGTESFRGCSKLQSIDSDKIISLGQRAFQDCSMLECINLTHTTSIPDNCFSGCSSLSDLSVSNPNDIVVGGSATIPVSALGSNCFNGALNNISVILPNISQLKGFTNSGVKEIIAVNCTSVAQQSINLCTKLINIELGNITSFGYECFYNDTMLANVSISNETITYDSVNDKCVITWPVTTISGSAFSRCTSLFSQKTFEHEGQQLTKPVHLVLNSITSLDNGFISGTQIREITIGGTVTTIPSYSFADCTNLRKVNLSSNITAFYAKAFANTGIQGEFVIPNNVTYIGDYCFERTPEITCFIFESTTPPTFGTGNPFSVYENNTLVRYIYVPDSAAQDYTTALSGFASYLHYTDAIRPISQKPS